MVDSRTGGYNWIGLILTIASLFELSTRPVVGNTTPTKETHAGSSEGRLSMALPLGSLIFGLHCFMTDPSTIISWTWTGYPISGPVPHIHGSLTLIAQAIGILIPITGFRSVVESPAWFAFGSASAFALYAYNDWPGFFGGLGLAVFLTSIIPHVMGVAPKAGAVGRFYFISFFVAILLYLANVWTVAYAFVPAGFILRERSDM